MNKKGFLFLSFIFVFSFLFIGNVKAIDLPDSLTFTRFTGSFEDIKNGVYDDYVFMIYSENGGTGFLSDVVKKYQSNEYLLMNTDLYLINDEITLQTSSNKGVIVQFKNIDDKVYIQFSNEKYIRTRSKNYLSYESTSTFDSTCIYIKTMTIDSNNRFHIIDKNNNHFVSYYHTYLGKTVFAPQATSYGLQLYYAPIIPKTYSVNFHLNGGTSFDTSKPLSPVLHETDYTLEMNATDLNSYLESLTLMKNKATFLGWYYDANFTQPYNSSDTISSDIDLYAKFRSDIYNTNNIDYIEYKFDNIPLQENTINYNFYFQSVTQDGLDETIQFAQPFGREYYTGCDDEGQNCTTESKYKDKLFYDLGHIDSSYEYEDSITFNSDVEHITNSYSVIVPFEHSMASYVYLNFDSSSDYEMIIHYKSDEGSNNSYIDTVDITGKYGAIFLPKYDNSNYVDEDSFYLTNFRIVGNVDVQVTDSREMTDYNILQLYSMNYCNNTYSNQTEIPYSCDNLDGIFTFKIDNLTANQTLRFLNHGYTEMSDRRTLIEYDTRYFNYGILDNPFSVVDIEDPTTHDIETVGLSEFYNQFNKQNIEDSQLTFKSAFNRFLNPIKFIFKHITKLFNNYLNESMQHYFYLAFCLMLVILLLKVIF